VLPRRNEAHVIDNFSVVTVMAKWQPQGNYLDDYRSFFFLWFWLKPEGVFGSSCMSDAAWYR
jgi:hypothetical protein